MTERTGAPVGEPSAGRGLTLIAAATALAGLGGYAVTTIGARALGPTEYAAFAVYWGALYLVVGSLAGFQQELSRSSARAPEGAPDAAALVTRFAAASAIVVAIGLGLAMSIMSPAIFADGDRALGLPLVVGAVVYVAVAVATGVLYGTSSWNALAVVIVLDVVLRGVGFAISAAVGADITTFAWASVIPFPLVLLVLIGVLARGPRLHLDTGIRGLAANSARTVAAGVGASVLVSGFPLVIGLAAGASAEVGVLVYVLVLARAPLVVTTMALQSYLVVVLRRRRDRVRATLVMAAALAVLGVVAAAAAWFWGPALVELLAGPAYAVAPVVPALLVLVSTATGWLTLVGAAVLASGDHTAYVAGWAAGAVVAVVLLFALPGEPLARVAIALAVGPLVGVAIQLTRLLRHGAQHAPRSDDA